MKSTNDKELLKKLLDDDEDQDVELQKGPPMIAVVGVPVKTPSTRKKNGRGEPRGPRGCCKSLCKCIYIMMLIFTLLAIFTAGCAYFWLNNALDQLSIETDSPQKFPAVYKSESELDNVVKRVDHFYNSVIFIDRKIEDLVLEQDEINGFIGHSDYLRGNLMVTFHEDLIVEDFSLPLNKFGFGDRYFVGHEYLHLESDEAGEGEGGLIEMKVETEAKHQDWFDGPLFFMQLQYLIKKNKEEEGQSILELFLEKGSLFGQVVPQEAIDEREDLLENLFDGLDFSEITHRLINGIESVSIEEGRIVIKARGG